jgi:hypothetical protein
MEVTPQEARDLLSQTNSVAAAMRSHTMYRRIGPPLMVWGVVWLVCFPLTAFFPAHSGWIWLIGDSVGFAGSAIAGMRSGRTVRSPSCNAHRTRGFCFWLAFIAYASFWIFLLSPQGSARVILFIVTLVSFAYVAMGLLLQLRFMLWLGLGITALAVGGYALFAAHPNALNLWMGITGGLALLVTGVYVSIKAR